MSKQKQDCPVCEGWGTLESGEGEDKETCPYCQGTGEEREDEEYYMR